MRNQDDVGLWELAVIGHRLHAHAYWIDLYLQAVVVDLDTGMLDACETYFLATLGCKLVGLLLRVAAEYHHTGDGCHKDFLYHIIK
jgi:hypothetical protein